jgi:hypothetical protein
LSGDQIEGFFHPGVNKTGIKRKPSFFNVLDRLRVEKGAEYLERGVEISCVGNLGEFRPLRHDLFFFICILDNLGSIGKYILVNVPGAEHVN